MKHIAWPLLLWTSLAFGQQFKLGSKVTDFTLYDLSGAPAAFSTLRGPVTVVVFISTQCPVSNGYNERMNALYQDYSAKGVKFVFVNANRTEPAKEVAEHAKAVGFKFPVYKDNKGEAAERFDAQVTPETYVIGKDGVMLYHGAIDDSKNEARIRQRGLRTALDAVLSGQPVPVAETKAFGCTIKRVRKTT